MRVLILMIAGLLTACAQTEVVQLKHPSTGKTVQCGPYPQTMGRKVSAVLELSQCVEDYKDQGYQRL